MWYLLTAAWLVWIGYLIARSAARKHIAHITIEFNHPDERQPHDDQP